jgi:hypothetical protein
MDMIAALKVTPFDFKSKAQDLIEEDPEPHSHPDPQPPKESQRSPKRLRIYDADLKNLGYTDGCPRCNFIKRGQIVLAGGTRHNEECRQRVYQEMREAGTEKLKRADLEHASRTQTQSKKSGKKVEEVPMNVHDAPMEPLEIDMNVVAPASAPGDHSMRDVLDTYDFHEEVDEALDGAFDIDYNGDDVEDSPDTVMNPLMDVLQTLGVDVLDAVDYCKRVVRSVPICATTIGEPYRPTFFEFYGQGNLVKASHGPRRNLNLDGLRAFDLRTSKPNDEQIDFGR